MDSRRADYRIGCDSHEQALRLQQALEVETRDAPPRTRVEVKAIGPELLLTITSDDTRGLRAATHSFLRWAQTALDVDRVARERART